jgi:Cu(I)/Ag(I) efflux system protein CusF
MKLIATLSLLVALSVVTPNGVLAQSSDMSKKDPKATAPNSMDMKSMDMKNAAPTTHKGVGLVKNVNAADGVVTLAHEPIKSLNWPAMTMGFKVKDKILISQAGRQGRVHVGASGNEYLHTDMR